MAKKTEYQITVGYHAILTFMVKCENEDEAKKIALEKINGKGIYEGNIENETYAVDGVLNLDRTWNII